MNGNKKNVVRLTESQLRNLINESVMTTLSEGLTSNMALSENRLKNVVKNLIREMIESEQEGVNPIIQTVLQHTKYIVEDFGKKFHDDLEFGSGNEEYECYIDKEGSEYIGIQCRFNYYFDYEDDYGFTKEVEIESLFVYDTETEEEFDLKDTPALKPLYNAIVQEFNEVEEDVAQDYADGWSEWETQRNPW